MDIVRITSQPKAFPWGGKTFIQDLVKASDLLGTPIGELWMGVHPNAPSSTISEHPRLLSEFLQDHPSFTQPVGALPFLLKVMAIERPLSIQCHPNAEQAKQGWLQETEKRRTTDKALWNYQDANPKPEMLVALSPCTAMCGFRSFKEIRTLLKRLLPASYQRLLADCETKSDPVRAYFETLYRLEPSVLASLIDEYRLQVLATEDDDVAPYLSARTIALQAIEAYPLDPGVLSPYLLQVVHLAVGEGIYLKAGVVHAYVRGNGIELMNNSDTILRAGLTDKHMDIDELVRVMDTSYQATCRIPTSVQGNCRTYCTDAKEFSLSSFTAGRYREHVGSLSLLFCYEGKTRIKSGNEILELSQGECALVGASLTSYELEVQGSLFRASYPHQKECLACR